MLDDDNGCPVYKHPKGMTFGFKFAHADDKESPNA